MRPVHALAASSLAALALAACASAHGAAEQADPPAAAPAAPAAAQASPDPAVAEQVAAVARGRAFAEKVCAACHGLDSGQASPYPPAPSFTTFAGRFTELTLQRRLTEISESGHTQMPQTMVHSDDIADLVAYLNSQGPAD